MAKKEEGDNNNRPPFYHIPSIDRVSLYALSLLIFRLIAL